MITVFNRREPITIAGTQKFFNLRETLSAAGIPSHVKIRSGGSGWSGRDRGVPGLRREDLDTYTVCVRRDDYDKAAAAMRSAPRNG